MGTVHVVATPIGNLEDITLRALRVLEEADLVYAEDTRRTRILLQRHEISARPVSLGAHNEAARIGQALEVLDGGGCIALVSDAGTPLVSDPGGRLVEAAAGAGHVVESIPGPSAVLAALSICGLRVQPFTFLGFLPRKGAARRRLIADYATRPETLVIFESPRRVASTLAELAEAFGADRRACVARELTKLHEQVVRGALGGLASEFAEQARGEFTLVIEGALGDEVSASAGPDSSVSIEEEVAALVAAGRRPREVAALLAPGSGVPHRSLYAMAVAERQANSTLR